ncbi:MAG: hypothetical protein JWL73_3621 [Actinomycetia bacterium]|nr:hypothetical protein [Actinomycetes bacterium]
MARVAPEDETRRRELPTGLADPTGWCDAHQFDLAAADGSLGVSVRLALHPGARRAWYWAYVVRPDEGPVAVRDHDVPYPREGLEVRAEGLWAELICETPLEHWSLGLEAFGVQLDDPLDATRGEIGTRMPVGLDVEWEIMAPADPDPEPTGYVQPGLVHGEVLLGALRIVIDGFGTHRHEWGPAPWRSGVAARLSATSAGTAISATQGVDEALHGWRWVRGVETDRLERVDRGLLETRRDARGLPAAARVVMPRQELEVEVIGLAPVPIEGGDGPGRLGRLDRGLIRAVDGSDDGGASAPLVGWAEWFGEGGGLGAGRG